MIPEPHRADLAAIEAEWPVIAAELEVVDAECRLARTPADALTIRAHRRAVRGLLTALAQHEPTAEVAAPLPLVSTTTPTHLVSGTNADAA